ncbi:BRI1 kinase inhibitor 1 [Hibiscus trionum]|uniref:BRI1 kinase inhibitor 1 n=1 Tax=Hibiscus trionum TaxID=183268 RepID=A0A9W7JK82_HIBTR|nr:BRI1 kinase inhibitor 1 [Hibiscus trionum]
MEKVEGLADKQQPSTSMLVSSPSSSSSPSHEFSFTISLHSSSSNTVSDKTKAPPSSIAIDLTPADDIFFHGHLLPLRLLSHLPVSPRSSTNSLDSFTLPIKELLDDDPKPERTSKSDSNIRSINGRSVNNKESKAREKSKSFSLFSFARRQKGRVDSVDVEEKEKHKKKKMRFDLSHLLKRYIRMVRPLLFFKGKRDKLHVHRQAYSFSGNLGSIRNKKEDELMRGRRGEYYSSAPASMRTSPTNSGLLVATTGFASSTSDSTMEELQGAIQAAIAHCKNSIRGEDKLKC